MTIDTIDDLQSAEEMIGLLNARIVALHGEPKEYCRPSCLDNAEKWDGCDTSCGCPCHEENGRCGSCGQAGTSHS